ncbi:ATP-binding protein [uncultured Nocardioides sp.]|uniref:sensor histidine kinase n=1 Tax=uncultured Nocardioides sp. TaxID=198441 RepID=UPI002612AFAA|nr:ATP-binding protein [uncultured Nocardioides sp.]
MGARGWSVARQVLLLQVVLVVTTVLVTAGLAAYDAQRDARAAATERAVAVARAVADSPAVTQALRRPDPSATLQPFAESVRTDADVDFVTIMTTEGIRWTHPDPDLIGERFVGDLGDAPRGGVLTQEFEGTLGPSMRAVVPVRGDAGPVALVSVGITVESIRRSLGDDLALVGVAALVVLALGLVGSALVHRRVRRQTHGLGEREITRMYEYYSAVLGAVREGLLLLDRDGRVQQVNAEARRLLSLPEDAAGRPLSDLDLPPGLVDAATGGDTSPDDLYLVGDRVLLVSTSAATWQDSEVGSVVTLRDHTELRAVTGELDAVRGLTESLRAQSHESANLLHTVVSLLETGRVEEAVDLVTEELQLAQLLTDQVIESVGDPVVAALLLGKLAQATERGVALEVSGDLGAGGEVPREVSRDLVTVVGNLVDNAFDAVSGEETRRVRVELGGAEAVRVVVGDNGPGFDEDAVSHALERGWSTKAGGDAVGRGLGLALVAAAARRHGGEVTLGRSDLGGARIEVVMAPAPSAAPAVPLAGRS